MKTRKESFYGLHFDYHGQPEYGLQGATLKEEEIREICTTLRPDFIQIDCKGHPGWASYPSELGNALPEFALDTLALWRKVTREEDVALYMHYSGIFDVKYTTEHPEDVALDPDGNPKYGTNRADGGYDDNLLIPQLSELAEKYGVDGFWVDGECWYTNTDFRPQTLANFQKETGIDLKGAIPASKGDPYYEEYRDYHRELFRRHLRHYVDTLHARFPHLQIASNWAFSDHMPEKVSANVDYLSGDLDPKNSIHSARYAARALAQQEGYPWDLMSWNFRIASGSRSACVAKHPNQILQEAAAVISLGGAYQDYIMQYKDGSPNIMEIRGLAPLPGFLRARQPYCFRGIPLREAAVLLSTHDRKLAPGNLYSRAGCDKAMGLTALLCDIGQSLSIISEHRLDEGLSDYGLIAVPELLEALEPETVSKLLAYAENGGNLLLCGKKTCEIFARGGAPFSLKEWDAFFPEGVYAYDNGKKRGSERLPKAFVFTHDRKSYGSFFDPVQIEAKDSQVLGWMCETLRVGQEHYPLAVRIPYGKGTVSVLGFDIGYQYLDGTQYLHRDLMRKMVDDLYDPTCRIESVCGMAEITCLKLEDCLTVQLFNAGGSHANFHSVTDDYIPPVLDLSLSIRLKEKPAKILLQPEGKELPFEWKNGRAYVTVDRVNIHEILQIIEE